MIEINQKYPHTTKLSNFLGADHMSNIFLFELLHPYQLNTITEVYVLHDLQHLRH